MCGQLVFRRYNPIHTFQSQRILHAFETLQMKKQYRTKNSTGYYKSLFVIFLVCGLFHPQLIPCPCKSKPNKSIHSTLHVERISRLSGMHSSLLYKKGTLCDKNTLFLKLKHLRDPTTNTRFCKTLLQSSDQLNGNSYTIFLFLGGL